jgi:lactoylglutathione lyase
MIKANGIEKSQIRLNYAIIFVSDMQRGIRFYRDIIGLPLRFESPDWSEFETEGVTLALHSSANPNPNRDDPKQIPPGRCRPGLRVSSLDDFHRRMVENNVTCIQEPKEVLGARIAEYVDPDGLPISISEG